MKKVNRNALGFYTAIAAFVFGWALTIAGFVVSPVGQVHDSVLWILGQSLLYCGAVVGISTHYSTELRHFKHEIATFVDEEERKRYNHSDIDIDRLDNSLDDSTEEET